MRDKKVRHQQIMEPQLNEPILSWHKQRTIKLKPETSQDPILIYVY